MKSYSTAKQDRISYYPLPDEMADVYLRKELAPEQDNEGNTVFVYDEVHFAVSQDITKTQIEDNFDLLFEDAEALNHKEPSLEERLEALEIMELERILGGIL